VLSNDAANAVLHRVQVVPISRIGGGVRRWPTRSSTASTLRLQRRMGRLTRDDIDAVRAVRVQLDL
jgi:mRNA-degrading endonuclease toxin of MazEF toxin-antitoxin module